MTRQDPLRGFRFLLEIDGITSGGFTRVKGLSREVKYESYREGGVNEYEHKLVTQVIYPVVVLERGLALASGRRHNCIAVLRFVVDVLRCIKLIRHVATERHLGTGGRPEGCISRAPAGRDRAAQHGCGKHSGKWPARVGLSDC